MSLLNRRFALVIGFLTFLFIMAGLGQAQDTGFLSPDYLAIQGRWVRADAPYVIELRNSKSNVLEATYFNPSPIHVEKTETAQKNGLQYVMIQLQDVNYEGSIYLLNYNRDQDALKGIYIHGKSGQRFEVSFSRQGSS